MIFFTDEKFQNNTSHIEYEKYCRDNWDKFPEALKVIQFQQIPEEILDGVDKVTLHDSRITSFDQDEDVITIKLDADNFGGLRIVTLKYMGVTDLKKPNKNVLGKDIENPNSDLMCHEAHVGKNCFKHSILFASNELLKISFKEIEISFEDK